MKPSAFLMPSAAEPAERRRCEKKCYADKKAALSAINYRMQRHGDQGNRRASRRGKVKYLRAYHCESCNAWHLTHKRQSTHIVSHNE
jgi:hypothetical protein